MENEQDYIKAGEIAAKALKYGAELIKPGASWSEVADKIEAKIHELGGEIAFPAQMSLGDVAAHYIPALGEDVVFKDEVVCLDVGVHVNGARPIPQAKWGSVGQEGVRPVGLDRP